MKLVGNTDHLELLKIDVQTQIRTRVTTAVLRPPIWYLQDSRVLTRADHNRYYTTTLVYDQIAALEGNWLYLAVVVTPVYREVSDKDVWSVIRVTLQDLLTCNSVCDYSLSTVQDKEEFYWRYVKNESGGQSSNTISIDCQARSM